MSWGCGLIGVGDDALGAGEERGSEVTHVGFEGGLPALVFDAGEGFGEDAERGDFGLGVIGGDIDGAFAHGDLLFCIGAGGADICGDLVTGAIDGGEGAIDFRWRVDFSDEGGVEFDTVACAGRAALFFHVLVEEGEIFSEVIDGDAF